MIALSDAIFVTPEAYLQLEEKMLQTYTPDDQSFELQSINLTASFTDLYQDVELEAIAYKPDVS